MGAQKDFVSGAEFVIWCNVSITAGTIVACAPQLRTLFYSRLRKSSQDHVARRNASSFPESLPPVSIAQSPVVPPGTPMDEKRSKFTPLVISDKFLSGDGKVCIGNAKAGVGDQRLTESRRSSEAEIDV
jgi:hypothetical protein